jgi:hypothetical protein
VSPVASAHVSAVTIGIDSHVAVVGLAQLGVGVALAPDDPIPPVSLDEERRAGIARKRDG